MVNNDVCYDLINKYCQMSNHSLLNDFLCQVKFKRLALVNVCQLL